MSTYVDTTHGLPLHGSKRMRYRGTPWDRDAVFVLPRNKLTTQGTWRQNVCVCVCVCVCACVCVRETCGEEDVGRSASRLQERV